MKRWREIPNEADRIGEKHLLTLQEGQFREMTEARVRLARKNHTLAKKVAKFTA